MKSLYVLLALTFVGCGSPSPKAPINNSNNLNNLNNTNNTNNTNNVNNGDSVKMIIANLGESSVYTLGRISMRDNEGNRVELENLCLPRPAVEPQPFEFRPGDTIERVWDGTIYDQDCEELTAPNGEYFFEFCYGTELIDGFTLINEECSSAALALGTDRAATLEIVYTASPEGNTTAIVLNNDVGLNVAVQAVDNCQANAWATIYDANNNEPLFTNTPCGNCSCRDAKLSGMCDAIFCADDACEAPRAEFVEPNQTRETMFYGVDTDVYDEEGYTCYQPALAPLNLEVEVCVGTEIVGEEFNSQVSDPVCARFAFTRGDESLQVNVSDVLGIQ